jgi:hypothetical protein
VNLQRPAQLLTAALAALALATVGAVIYIQTNKRIGEQGERIERVEGGTPCWIALHSERCQDRTCVRLADVGYKLTPECRERLARLAARGGDAQKPKQGSQLPRGSRPRR